MTSSDQAQESFTRVTGMECAHARVRGLLRPLQKQNKKTETCTNRDAAVLYHLGKSEIRSKLFRAAVYQYSRHKHAEILRGT